MSAAETALKHASLVGPGTCVHPTAVEKLLKESNAVGLAMVSGEAPEKIMAALNGGSIGCRTTSPETENPPAD
jgi:hypothetical protein